MAVLFTEILEKALEKGTVFNNTLDASNWFRKESSKVSEDKADPEDVLKEDKASLKRSTSIGKLYLFQYSPKWAKELPYYDTFPVVFPFAKVSDGFYGINMHYLPLDYRARLMDALYRYTDRLVNEDSRLKISYDILSSVSKLKYFRPCVKHYLNTQLKSRFLEVPATQWDIALFLPLERFQKASKQRIYRDSRNIIKGRYG